MNRFSFIFFLNVTIGWSQVNSIMKIPFELGDTTLNIVEHWGGSDEHVIFLNVHEDESTSIETLLAYSALHPIDYFYLNHAGTRRIAFERKGKRYDFDPNRIFTKKGRRKTLKDGAASSRGAKRVLKELAKQILVRLPKSYTVVALHNNSDVNYSIKNYLPGGDESQNTKSIYINDAMDPDDFIYTTDPHFFSAFETKGINVILQDNSNYVNDGSLSVYCGKKGIRYINIETQKGHFQEQMQLMEHVLSVIRKTSL